MMRFALYRVVDKGVPSGSGMAATGLKVSQTKKKYLNVDLPSLEAKIPMIPEWSMTTISRWITSMIAHCWRNEKLSSL